ncbi:MAG: Fic family protein [Bacteroidales bacterium]|nr:Fic family protein [Bacteroidales bacterium]
MIEKAPKLTQKDLVRYYTNKGYSNDSAVNVVIDKVNENYEYWDTVKYKKRPDYCSAEELWKRVKMSRILTMANAWDKYKIDFGFTNKMQRLCHEFDMNFGQGWMYQPDITEDNKKQYLKSSLMEEAIFSSMIEGAATTRKVAKEMLRLKKQPKDKSQQMIVNNYNTIQFISSHKDTPLSVELLLQIHRLITEKTLKNEEDAGRFRKDEDDIVVFDVMAGETVHTPPAAATLPHFANDLCKYFNDKDAKPYVHPIIRGIIIHFMVGYFHPFVDGNGRTARALFYWYMLKEGYWMTEYLSISRVIAKSKTSYEKAYLYTEADDMDLGYFINYNLKVLEQAYRELKEYIQRKQAEKKASYQFMRLGYINDRQAQVIQRFVDDPSEIITVKDLQERFFISPTTAKQDIVHLMERGLLKEIAFNKVKKGYIKGDKFDEMLATIS